MANASTTKSEDETNILPALPQISGSGFVAFVGMDAAYVTEA